MCPSKLPQSCRKQKVMTAQYCGQPVRLAAPRPPLLFSLFSLVLFFQPCLSPPLLSFLWKWASVHNDLQPHPQGTKRKENRSIASGRWRESDKQEDRGVTVARRRRRGEDDKKKRNLTLNWGKWKISPLLEASRAQSWIWQERWVSIPFLTSLIKPLTLKTNPPHWKEEDLSPLDIGHFEKKIASVVDKRNPKLISPNEDGRQPFF